MFELFHHITSGISIHAHLLGGISFSHGCRFDQEICQENSH